MGNTGQDFGKFSELSQTNTEQKVIPRSRSNNAFENLKGGGRDSQQTTQRDKDKERV